MTNFQYYVVEFLERPHPTVPRFVCVPYAWMRATPTSDNTTAIVFPQEQFVATEGRIISGEPYNSSWPVYIVNIKFGCDNLNEGRKYAVEQCSATNVDEDDQSNQNVQFRKLEKPIRSGKRSISVDESSLNKGSKRSNLHKTHISSLKIKQDFVKEQKKLAKERILVKKLTRVFKEMHEDFDNVSDTLANMCEAVDNIKSSLSKAGNLTSKILKKEKQKQNSKENNKIDKAKSKKSYKFPDNSDTSSKWTLRFREPQDGLVELLPGSKVYVRKAVLETIHNETDDARSAARMLMLEIFSDHALTVCSLAGGKGSLGGGTRQERFPPGLDEYSRIILMMYLKEYAESRDWEIDEQRIWMALRNKLLEYRKNNSQNYSF